MDLRSVIAAAVEVSRPSIEERHQALVARGFRIGGLGVGLAVAKRLVELHGGAIEARSAGRRHGSEFIVRLPLTAESATGVTQNAPRHRPHRRESSSSRTIRIRARCCASAWSWSGTV